MRSIISLFFFVNLAFSSEYGKATYESEASVKHNGDFIEFYVETNAICRAEDKDAKELVIKNVASLLKWLSGISQYKLSYSAQIINSGFHQDITCKGYFANQLVKITLHRLNEKELDDQHINNF